MYIYLYISRRDVAPGKQKGSIMWNIDKNEICTVKVDALNIFGRHVHYVVQIPFVKYFDFTDGFEASMNDFCIEVVNAAGKFVEGVARGIFINEKGL